MFEPIVLRPEAIGNLINESQYDAILKNLNDHKRYDPFVRDGNNKPRISYDNIVRFIHDRGFLWDGDAEKWYRLGSDGLFLETNVERIRAEIYALYGAKITNANMRISDYNGLISQIKGTVNIGTLSREYEDYLTNNPDSDHNDVIALKNGLFDTETGELYPHNGLRFEPYYYNVEYQPKEYDDLVTDPIYDYYKGIIPNEEILTAFFKWCGNVLFGESPLPMILFLYGSGGTGKTSLTLALSEVLGTRATTTPIDLLLQPFGMSTLNGKRLEVIDEVEDKHENSKIFATKVKQITGGDIITANEKYKQPYQFRNEARVVMLGNSYPNFDVSDGGIERRIFPIECNQKQKFSDHLHKNLKTPEAVNWLFNMAFYHYRNTDDWDPSAIFISTMDDKTHWLETNPLNGFLMEYCDGMESFDKEGIRTYLDDCGVSTNTIYQEYRLFANTNGYLPMNIRNFMERIRLNFDMETRSSSIYTTEGKKTITKFKKPDSSHKTMNK